MLAGTLRVRFYVFNTRQQQKGLRGNIVAMIGGDRDLKKANQRLYRMSSHFCKYTTTAVCPDEVQGQMLVPDHAYRGHSTHSP